MRFPKLLVAGFLFVLFLNSCDCTDHSHKSNVTISGKIMKPSNDSIWIKYTDPVSYRKMSESASLDSNGSFILEFHLESPVPATFYDGNESSGMFLHPGDDLFLTLNTDEFDETIKYEGEGSIVNNYLTSKFLKFDDNGVYYVYNMRDSLGTEGGVEYVKNLGISRLNYFNKYFSDKQIPSKFRDWELTTIRFEPPSLVAQLTYNKPIDSNMVLVYDFIASYIDSTPDFYPCSSYDNFLRDFSGHYVYFRNMDAIKQTRNYDSVSMNYISSQLSGFPREKLIANKTIYKLEDFNTEFYDKYIDIINSIKDTALTNLIQNGYKKAVKTLETKMPENAFLSNLRGTSDSLITYAELMEKYKGNVVYLDFWASWCGPCKSEMPFSLELQDYFKGKDVSFIYFSSEKDSMQWKKYIKVLQISGDHYLLTKDVRKQANDLFDVRYIPRYILIDKQGKVIDDKAKRPSDKEGIITDIENLL